MKELFKPRGGKGPGGLTRFYWPRNNLEEEFGVFLERAEEGGFGNALLFSRETLFGTEEHQVFCCFERKRRGLLLGCRFSTDERGVFFREEGGPKVLARTRGPFLIKFQRNFGGDSNFSVRFPPFRRRKALFFLLGQRRNR